jgi:hypothetical protein
LVEGCHRLIDIGLRGSFPGEQLLRARRRDFGKLKRSFRARQITLSLSDSGLEYCRIDLRYDLSRFHLRIKIREQFGDITRNLAADLDGYHWVKRACRGHRLGDWTTRHFCRLIICGARCAALPDNERDNEQADDKDKPAEKTFHSRAD